MNEQENAAADAKPAPPPLEKLDVTKLRSRSKLIPASSEMLGSFNVRRMSSDEVRLIEKSFPTDAEGKCADNVGYMRKLVATAVVDEAGTPLLTIDDLATILDPGEFWGLWDVVTEALHMKRSAKN